MTLGDIINRYCEYHNLEEKTGRIGENDPLPILPFLIMDCAQLEFSYALRGYTLHHKVKQISSRWKADYHKFNQRLFSCLNPDQRDFVIDMMDQYEQFISKVIGSVKKALNNLAKDFSEDDRNIISSFMLVNIFSQVAQDAWENAFRTQSGKKEKCQELLNMRKLSHNFINAAVYFPEDLNANVDKDLLDSIDAYLDITDKWLQTFNEKKDASD